MRTGVALGSNLGDRLANLRAARDAIVDLPNVKSPVISSPVYETEPVDCEPDAGKFLNAVLEFEYAGEPAALLDQLLGIERSLGRERDHARKVSRKIDIDLLYCGALKIDNDRLQLPHPRMYLRKFVLQPLADIEPELVLPNRVETVRELLALLPESDKLVCLTKNWQAQ